MTSRFNARPGAPLRPVSDRVRSVTAPWVLDYQGQPLELTISPGEVAVYDEDAGLLHIRNEETGHSRTFTPTLMVTIDHDRNDPRYELEFRDPDNPRRFMPSVVIDQQGIVFNSNDERTGFTFSNRAMFETFCDFMASPVYNPFVKPIPPVTTFICADVQKRNLYYRAYVSDDDDDDPDPYLGREDEYPIDEKRPWFVSFIIQLDRSIMVWDRHERRDCELGAGQYRARVTRWNKETGDPERIIVEGTSDAGDWMQEGHVDWLVLETELRLAHARWGKVAEREPFDPSLYHPMHYDGPVVEKQTFAATKEMMPTTVYTRLDSYLGIIRNQKQEEQPQASSPKSSSFLKKLFGR